MSDLPPNSPKSPMADFVMAWIAGLEFPPPWTRLRNRENSPLVRLTVLIPLVGYLIIFNAHVIDYIELALELGGSANTDATVSSKLLSVYFGLCAIALASVIYSRYCVPIVMVL
jgi:hypothetical protein